MNSLKDLDGAVVALDPRNGEVLAMVSVPGFDPALFVQGITQKDYKALLAGPGSAALRPRSARAVHPGSTIKPFKALAGLNYGTLDPPHNVYCPGYFMLPGSSRQAIAAGVTTATGRAEHARRHRAILRRVLLQRRHQSRHRSDGRDAGRLRPGQAHPELDLPVEKTGLLPTREWKRRYRHESLVSR